MPPPGFGGKVDLVVHPEAKLWAQAEHSIILDRQISSEGAKVRAQSRHRYIYEKHHVLNRFKAEPIFVCPGQARVCYD